MPSTPRSSTRPIGLTKAKALTLSASRAAHAAAQAPPIEKPMTANRSAPT
jgi:hypothetical protein